MGAIVATGGEQGGVGGGDNHLKEEGEGQHCLRHWPITIDGEAIRKTCAPCGGCFVVRLINLDSRRPGRGLIIC